VVRFHQEILDAQQLPPHVKAHGIWTRRFDAINHFERHLVESGTIVLKFFLNVSRKEQTRRFLERIEEPEKNWKFSLADVREQKFWPAYMKAYEDVFTHTSTRWAPWYIVPADHKWFTRAAVAAVVNAALADLKLAYPKPSGLKLDELEEARKLLKGRRRS
jgi:polyphosphate kinase 2 (PPK2 family)